MVWTKDQQKESFGRFKGRNPNYFKEYYLKNKKRMNNYANKYHEDLRRELIMVVQGYVKCNLCPITDISLLHAHHVNINGKEDRARFIQPNGEADRIAWARYMIEHYQDEKDKYPLQVLCVNCHKHLSHRPQQNNTLTSFMC